MKKSIAAVVWALGSALLGCGDDAAGSGSGSGSGGATGSGGAAGDGASAATSSTSAASTAAATTTGATTGATTTAATTTGAGGAGDGGSGDGGGGDVGGGSGTGGDGTGGGGMAAPGYGAITGTCGIIDLGDIQSSSPSFLENTIDFTGEPPLTVDDTSALTPGGQEIMADGNLGGSSLWSEAFAYEVLARCDEAVLLKTEAEIVYDTEGKKTDELVTIDRLKVGVSVVRAVGFPPDEPYTVDDALPVLEGKLDDILLSSQNVAPEDQWVKQILSILAYSDEHADAMVEAYQLMDDETRADTIVVLTVTHGDDDFLYFAE